jgi:hypothetical protein
VISVVGSDYGSRFTFHLHLRWLQNGLEELNEGVQYISITTATSEECLDMLKSMSGKPSLCCPFVAPLHFAPVLAARSDTDA